MNKSFLTPLFGANVDPSWQDPEEPFRRAHVADEHGLDVITLQDHPYIKRFFDTWTLLTALAMATQHVHVGTNVICTPLRPPAVLAKMAATLDVLCQGRLELGLGAGAFAEGIAAYGGAARPPGEALAAFEDAIRIVRGLWEAASTNEAFTYAGRVYQVHGAHAGPAPAHRIRIWTGAAGPRALRLTGRLADGILVSTRYVQPAQLVEHNRYIDAGAVQGGRSPSDIRHGYNLMGVLQVRQEDTQLHALSPGLIDGTVQHWVDEIVRYYEEYRQDTFIFWPVAGDELRQIEMFARDVVPAVRERLAVHISRPSAPKEM